MHSGNTDKQKQFMQFYEQTHMRLTRYVQSVIWNREDARDIISETILRAYETFDRIHKPESFVYYLFKIASRLIINKERKKKWWGFYDESTALNRSDDNYSTSERAEVKDLYNALNQLPVKQREAVVLFEISGFSLNEIQEMQGGTLSGVKSRVKRGRETLKKILTEEELLVTLK